MADPPADPPAGRPPGPRDAEVSPTEDASVPRKVFLTVGVLLAVMAAIYWFTAYEDAGTALLVVSGILGVWCGAYLWLQQRPRPDQPAPPRPGQAGGITTYLPHASIWPFTIGLGAATVLNGLVLGIWVVVPGAALMALGVGGFIRQTRRRD